MVGIYYGQIDFTMGWSYGLKAFTAAILGGIGNIPGAMIGGLLLGVIEALAAGYIAIAWKDAIAFLVLILILIIRPTASWANARRTSYEARAPVHPDGRVALRAAPGLQSYWLTSA